MSANITKEIADNTLYFESSKDLTIESIVQFTKQFHPRDIRMKDGFATVEMRSQEAIQQLLAIEQTEFNIFTNEQWDQMKSEANLIKKEMRSQQMIKETGGMQDDEEMDCDDNNLVRVSFISG